MRKSFFEYGFTLAEVLITLGIIGVVAAMTIPNLMTAYKAHKYRAQFLKSYSILQQAFKQMEADDVSTDISSYPNNMGSFYNTFKVYFKGAHWCGYYRETSNVLPCTGFLTQKYKTLNGEKIIDTDYFTDGQIVLPDGTLILIDNPNWGDFVYLFVDLNGYGHPPNRLGYDLFAFQFIDGELRTMGDMKTRYNDVDGFCSIESTSVNNGMTCAQKAKQNSDYFKWVVKNVK